MRRIKTADQHRPYVDLVDRAVIHARREPIVFRRTRQRISEVRDWFATRCGWAVVQNLDLIRLVKTPARLYPGMGFGWAQEPLDYELFTWVLWYAEKIPDVQFVLSELVREIEAQANSSIRQGHIDWNQYGHRQALRRALMGLEELGAIRRVDRDADEWVYRGVGEALYEFTSLVPHLYINLPAHLHTRLAVLEDPSALQDEAATGGSIPAEQRLYRTLLMQPALYRADDPEAFAILQSRDRRRNVVRDLSDHFGWDLEVTESYACLLRPSASEASEAYLFPFRGAVCHVILLLMARLQELVSAGRVAYDPYDRLLLPVAQLRHEIVELKARWGENWGTTLAKLPTSALVEEVLEVMRTWGLLQGPDQDDQVFVLPLGARFRGVYREEGLDAEGDDGE
jgi:uncharacterized protein (TIGR02678 family)